jgi:hypothetical protein
MERIEHAQNDTLIALANYSSEEYSSNIAMTYQLQILYNAKVIQHPKQVKYQSQQQMLYSPNLIETNLP